MWSINASNSGKALIAGLVLLWLLLLPAAMAVRIGVVVNLQGSVGEATRWALDGFLVGIHEHNRNATTTAIGAVIRNNDSEYIHVTIMDIKDDLANMWRLVPKEMNNASTRLDGLALAPGPAATTAVLNASRIYNLPVFGPNPGDRSVFQAYDPLVAIGSPIPDAEIAALVEEVVVRRQLKRIAVMTTDFYTFGNDLVPYLKTLLAEFGLELVFHVVVGDPRSPGVPLTRGPLAAQLRGLAAANAQAMFVLCALFADTAPDIYAAMGAMGFKAVIATTALTMPLLEGLLRAIPATLRPPTTVITSLYLPLHSDLRFVLSRSYRNAFSAATSGGFVNASTTLAEQETTKTLAGNLGMSGYGVARLVSAAVAAHNGAPGPITAASLQAHLRH